MEPQAVSQRVAALVQTFSLPDADPAWLTCDRHPRGNVAFTFAHPDGSYSDLTFGELHDRSAQFAGLLANLGIGPGDRVATLMGKGVDLVATIVGIWRAGAVYVPLFTAFSTDAVESRLAACGAALVVVDAAQRHKIGDDTTWRVLVAGEDPDSTRSEHSLSRQLTAAMPEHSSRPLGGDGAMVHMFTSGTTGKPKGVVHPLKYAAGWQAYLEFALGLEPASVYWSAADPGWAYGLYTAVVAPMLLGMRSVLQVGGFDVTSTWRTLVDLRVSDFAAAPTVFRALRSSTLAVPDGLRLRRLSSAGEPLTPDVNEWAGSALGLLVHDHFGQTELGMTAGFPHHPAVQIPVAPRSMGTSLPGWSVTTVQEGGSRLADSDAEGRLAIDVAQSPFMTFAGYAAGRSSADRFTPDGAFYLTGDLAVRDADGLLHFSSRDDDVIIMAGYRIGPFDIETVLARHPAVAECAVVAGPDPVRGEVVEAFVVLRADHTAGADLERELQDHVRQRYAAHAYPRRVHIVSSLPRTPSGKIQRANLRQELRERAGGSS